MISKKLQGVHDTDTKEMPRKASVHYIEYMYRINVLQNLQKNVIFNHRDYSMYLMSPVYCCKKNISKDT